MTLLIYPVCCYSPLPPDEELLPEEELPLLEEELRPDEALLPEEVLLLPEEPARDEVDPLREDVDPLLEAGVRPPPLEASPPARATRSRVALLADANPLLEVEPFEDSLPEEVPLEDVDPLLEEEERPDVALLSLEEDLPVEPLLSLEEDLPDEAFLAVPSLPAEEDLLPEVDFLLAEERCVPPWELALLLPELRLLLFSAIVLSLN